MLVSAAAELFAEQGFRRTTFVDIAERAGISRGSIPWHFGSKNGLLEAVVADTTANVLDNAARPAGVDEAIDQIRHFVGEPTTRLLITLIAEAVEPGSPVHAFYAEMQRTMRRWVMSWADDLQMPAGVSHEAFVAVVTGAIIGVHQQWRVAPEDVDLDRTLAALKAVILAFQRI
jgi:TetR/AcrR family acrAB operon transcriptional repressor